MWWLSAYGVTVELEARSDRSSTAPVEFDPRLRSAQVSPIAGPTVPHALMGHSANHTVASLFSCLPHPMDLAPGYIYFFYLSGV